MNASMMCDFCAEGRAAWEYPCSDFPLPVQGVGQEWSQGAWRCCALCKPLVDWRAWSELLGRIVPGEDALEGTYRAALVVLWQRFDEYRVGEARPWG